MTARAWHSRNITRVTSRDFVLEFARMERQTALAALCALDDSARAVLYEYVAGHDGPVSRDAAAEAVGLDRSTAAYHLDKLVDHGLLTASFARAHGRGGPGAGRPAKFYEATEVEIEASVPPRDYRLVADLLARAVGRSKRLRETLNAEAHTVGAELAAGADETTLEATLASLGYRPYADGDVIRMRNCPFHRLAQDHTSLVCGMNLALMQGITETLAANAVPVLDPAPGRCCVAIPHS